MEGLKRQIRYQIFDSKKAFIIFWSVVLAANAFSYFINGLGDSDANIGTVRGFDGTMFISVASANIIPIAIFIIVYSLIMYSESFEATISFSSTRRDFYGGVVIHNLLVCLGMALAEAILLKLDGVFIKLIGRQPLYEFGSLDLQSINIFSLAGMLFLYFILICAVCNFIGILFYRFGYKVWIGAIVAFLLLNTKIIGAPIAKLFEYFTTFNQFGPGLFKVTISAITLYCSGWMLVRRASIRGGK